MARRDNIVVGLDIGTTKICAIVGEIKEQGRIDIIGLGQHPSRGLRKGVVVNIESTVESIRRAVEEAELMAGVKITSVYAGIAGGHIKGFNSRAVVAIKDREITQGDIDRVVDAAKAVAIPLDREVLHILPREFIVDDQDGIKEPLGMSGIRLEAEIHIVTGAVTSVQNVVKSCQRAGLEVADIVLEPVASAEAVLTQEEKDLGVAIVDIGGGTTDILLFVDGGIAHSSVLAIGGNQVTNDIAVGLRTPQMEAETIKQRYGCALTDLVRDGESVEVPSVGGRAPRIVSRQILAEIIEPRAQELFELINRDIKKAGYEERIASGAVITGGTSILEGMPEIAERVMDLPVRRGAPLNIGGLVDKVSSPIYATGVGLVLFGARELEEGRVQKLGGDNLFAKVLNRMKRWVKEFF